MSMKIALSTAIGRAAFHPCKPVCKARVFFPHRVAFVVVKTGIHPFDIGRKDHIRSAKFSEEITPRSASQGCFHLGDDAEKLVLESNQRSSSMEFSSLLFIGSSFPTNRRKFLAIFLASRWSMFSNILKKISI